MEKPVASVLLIDQSGTEMEVRSQLWSLALKAASRRGWVPRGTVPPPTALSDDSSEATRWNGSYSIPQGQVVLRTDASQFSDCLEKIAEEHRNQNVRRTLLRLASFAKSGSFLICDGANADSAERAGVSRQSA